MATITALVDQALRTAGIPFESVSFVQDGNRATWTIQFLSAATDPQKAEAQTILDTVVTDATALHAQDRKDVQAYVSNMPMVEKAINLTILDQVNFIRARLPTPLGAITPAQWIQAVKDKVDTL
jgi:hypothetical protein